MNQATLITEIDTVINTNGTQAITGAILNGVLKDMFLNTYSAEIGVGLLPTVVSPVVTATDDLKTVLARIQLNATTGTNGIASIGGVLGLGSDLTQSTTIGGLHTLTLGDEGSNNPLNSFVVHTKNGMSFRNILSGVTNSLSMTANSSFYSLSNATTTQGWAASLGSFKIFAEDVSNDVFIKLHSTGQNVTGNGTDNNIIIQDKISNKGLVYATDYSANFTDESLVTKRWVAAALGAAAGLTATLAIDNKTNGIPIKSNDSNTFLTIINGGATFQSDGNINHNAAQHIFLGNFSAIGGNTGFGFNASSFSIYTGVNKYYTLTSAAATFRHTVKNTFNAPVNEFSNGGAYFVSGIGIDTTATGGTDVLNIGATNANVINYGNSSTTHNFLGTAIYELQVNSYVEDKLITLNYGGSVGSGIGVGFEIEEDNLITGFLKTNATRDGFSFQAPSIVHTAHFLFSSFTADRTFDLPDSSGTLALQSWVSSGYVPYTGATQDTDLGNYLLNAKSLHVKGTAGSGHLGLKHQSSNITAAASESSLGANSDGDATWKNDGNTIQKINVFKRTIFGNANYTALKSDDLVCTSVTFTTSRTVTLPSDSLQAHEITVADEFQTVTAINTLVIGVATGKYLNGVLNGTETIQSAGGWRRFKTDGAGNWSFDAGIVRQTKTQTLTNKTIQKRILVVTQSATPTTNIDNGDIVSITGLAQAITSMSSGLSGTPYDGQMIMWQITDNGTARAITWGASFASTTNFTLPTTTVISTMLRVLTQWNAVTSKHECIG